MYLVIKTGYEGIEYLYWLTSDPIESVRKAKELQICSVKEYIDNVYVFDDEESDEIVVEEITQEQIQHIKNSICIQKWTGSKFTCACPELDIKPIKLMLR